MQGISRELAARYRCELPEEGSRSDLDPQTLSQMMEMHQVEAEPLTPMFYVREHALHLHGPAGGDMAAEAGETKASE